MQNAKEKVVYRFKPRALHKISLCDVRYDLLCKMTCAKIVLLPNNTSINAVSLVVKVCLLCRVISQTWAVAITKSKTRPCKPFEITLELVSKQRKRSSIFPLHLLPDHQEFQTFFRFSVFVWSPFGHYKNRMRGDSNCIPMGVWQF